VVWLLRHGEAEEGSPDAERRLTRDGKEQAGAVGAALRALDVKLEVCRSSPKVRAAETARLTCEPLGTSVEVDSRLEGGPFDPRELLEGHEEVLLVGHDPDLSLAVHRMTGAQVRLPMGGLAGVDRGELVVLLRPRELAAIAG
jgi:phosphohistidine phosphatase